MKDNGNRLHPAHFSRRKIDEMVKDSGFGILRAYIGLPMGIGYGSGKAYTLLVQPVDSREKIKPATVTIFGKKA